MTSGYRNRCLAFAAVLALVVAASLCISHDFYFTLYSPVDVARSLAAKAHLAWTHVHDPAAWARERVATSAALPMYADVFSRALDVAKCAAGGILLALAGMLYQCTFRNPIAAPSMLGVSNGVSAALLLLVATYGTSAIYETEKYYLYSIVGGVLVLAIVLLGGWWLGGGSRRREGFNVVHLILVGTVISQFLGACITYAQNALFTSDVFTTYYQLQTAATLDSGLVFATLGLGLAVSIVPIWLFRFRLNLVSFSDEEVRLLGVNPGGLRLLALGAGSVMILLAQVNLGQVAMVSLVVPFVVRAVFGAEFSKQLGGNILVGALVMVLCGDVCSYVSIWGAAVDIGSAATIMMMPLFVWMLAIRQRSWGD